MVTELTTWDGKPYEIKISFSTHVQDTTCPWEVWIPAHDVSCFENNDPVDGAYLDSYGLTTWPTIGDAARIIENVVASLATVTPEAAAAHAKFGFRPRGHVWRYDKDSPTAERPWIVSCENAEDPQDFETFDDAVVHVRERLSSSAQESH